MPRRNEQYVCPDDQTPLKNTGFAGLGIETERYYALGVLMHCPKCEKHYGQPAPGESDRIEEVEPIEE